MLHHTPAPWIVTHGDALAIADAEGNHLACLSWGRGSVSMKIETEANEANACLMAAAPELLEALRDTKTQIQEQFGDNWDYSQIDAAIAKASK